MYIGDAPLGYLGQGGFAAVLPENFMGPEAQGDVRILSGKPYVQTAQGLVALAPASGGFAATIKKYAPYIAIGIGAVAVMTLAGKRKA